MNSIDTLLSLPDEENKSLLQDKTKLAEVVVTRKSPSAVIIAICALIALAVTAYVAVSTPVQNTLADPASLNIIQAIQKEKRYHENPKNKLAPIGNKHLDVSIVLEAFDPFIYLKGLNGNQ